MARSLLPRLRAPYLWVTLLILAVGVALFVALRLSGPIVRDTDVQIYRVLLHPWMTTDSKTVVVQIETHLGDLSDYTSNEGEQKLVDYAVKQAKVTSISADQMKMLLRDLRKRNQKQERIPQIGPKDKIVMVPAAELDRIFEDGSWEGFYRRFRRADGLFTASLPAYSADGNTAVVYWSHSEGGLAGAGWLSFLKKTGGKWSSAGKVMVWIS